MLVFWGVFFFVFCFPLSHFPKLLKVLTLYKVKICSLTPLVEKSLRTEVSLLLLFGIGSADVNRVIRGQRGWVFSFKALGLRVKACDSSLARNREAFVCKEQATGSPEAKHRGSGERER